MAAFDSLSRPVQREQGSHSPDFSVLLPVYIGDSAEPFRRALRSVGADQVLKPSLIVVVCDGPVQGAIATLLARAEVGRAAWAAAYSRN